MTDRDERELQILASTQRWLERAVIGLNLCPFAKAVHVKQQVRFVVSWATAPEAVITELLDELDHLNTIDPANTDTTLLILPDAFADFYDFNDFMTMVDAAVAGMQLEGVLQVANFHPDYQFAGTERDDISNYTNRSPYPILHLIRETSIDRAVAAFPDAASIYERNIETLEKMGHAGWTRLMADEGDPAP